MTSSVNSFNDNQLTKLCVFIGRPRIFTPRLNFYEAQCPIPP